MGLHGKGDVAGIWGPLQDRLWAWGTHELRPEEVSGGPLGSSKTSARLAVDLVVMVLLVVVVLAAGRLCHRKGAPLHRRDCSVRDADSLVHLAVPPLLEPALTLLEHQSFCSFERAVPIDR